jgi:hypothetical protein
MCAQAQARTRGICTFLRSGVAGYLYLFDLKEKKEGFARYNTRYKAATAVAGFVKCLISLEKGRI